MAGVFGQPAYFLTLLLQIAEVQVSLSTRSSTVEFYLTCNMLLKDTENSCNSCLCGEKGVAFYTFVPLSHDPSEKKHDVYCSAVEVQ